MLVDSTSIPLRNLQSSPPASCHGQRARASKRVSFRQENEIAVVILLRVFVRTA